MPHSKKQDITELIEDSPFSPQDKYKLLLVHLGVRPACTVSIASGVWRQGDHPKKIDTEVILDAHTVLKRACVVYDATDPLIDQALPKAPRGSGERLRQVQTFLVARNDSLLGKLKQAVRDRCFTQKVGLLYGWPLTSIEAVEQETVIPLARLVASDIMSDPGRFLDFPLSRQHWPAELNRVQDWVEVVKLHSPVIYEQVRMANWCRLNEEQVDGMFGRLDGGNTSKARHNTTI